MRARSQPAPGSSASPCSIRNTRKHSSVSATGLSRFWLCNKCSLAPLEAPSPTAIRSRAQHGWKPRVDSLGARIVHPANHRSNCFNQPTIDLELDLDVSVLVRSISDDRITDGDASNDAGNGVHATIHNRLPSTHTTRQHQDNNHSNFVPKSRLVPLACGHESVNGTGTEQFVHEPARPRPHRSLDSPGLQELCATGPCHPSACKLHQAAEGSRATSSCILPDAIRLSSASAFDTTQGSCSKMHLTSTRGSNASLRTVTNADFCLALGLSRLVMPQRVKQNLETIVDRGLVPELLKCVWPGAEGGSAVSWQISRTRATVHWEHT
jgi:hypothetical protein